MKDKILFWIDNEWLRFGFAKAFQDVYDCDLYALIDMRFTSRKFFETQKIVNFNKIWFYRDYIAEMKKPDLEYLKNFENKYNINLWDIVFAERFFFQYNPYYKFKEDEILSILYHECRLFEQILDEIKPDYLVIKMTDSHQSNLIVQLCKAKKIRVLMMGPTRFSYKYDIYEDYDQKDVFSEINQPKNNDNKSFEELRDYLQKYQAIHDVTTLESRTKMAPFARVKKYLQYLTIMGNKNFKNYYANFGKTRFSVITKFFFVKRPIRKYFLDKISIKNIDADEHFVYYPLHADPERSILLVAPFYTNQLEVLTHVSKSLPIGYKLYVKEHPAMFEYAWREMRYYKKLLELPNVKLIHPSVKSEELLKKCSLVVTISGTTGLEAAFYNKPSIVFSDVSYSVLPSVYRVKVLEELPMVVKNMLNKEVDLSLLNNYVKIAESKFIETRLYALYLDFSDYFFDEFVNGFGINISEQKMSKFLEQHKLEFQKLALEHVKKIQFYKSKSK